MRPIKIRISASSMTHQHWAEHEGQPVTVRVHSVAIFGHQQHADSRPTRSESWGFGETEREALLDARRCWREARGW